MSKPHILLVRHPSTESNETPQHGEKVKGISDIALTARGKRESTQLAEQLKDFPIDVLWYSNLQRTTYSALDIAWNHSPQLAGPEQMKPTKRLYSWDLGNYVGKYYDEAMPMIKRYATQWKRVPVPGGESFFTWAKRMLNFFGIRAENAKKGKTVGLLTHTWPIRLWAATVDKSWDVASIDYDILWQETPLGPAQAMVYEWDGEKWTKGREFCEVKEPTKETG